MYYDQNCDRLFAGTLFGDIPLWESPEKKMHMKAVHIYDFVWSACVKILLSIEGEDYIASLMQFHSEAPHAFYATWGVDGGPYVSMESMEFPSMETLMPRDFPAYWALSAALMKYRIII